MEKVGSIPTPPLQKTTTREEREGSIVSIIYEPKGKAREYSPLALNLYKGCDHRCEYCYVRTSMRIDNPNPVPRANIIQKLTSELERRTIEDQVLLSFTGDPYCEAEEKFRLTSEALGVLSKHNIPTAILTKGGMRCLRDIGKFKAFNSIKIGATLTFMSNEDSWKWEPGAVAPESRFKALQTLHAAGITTWASLEPVIDPEQSLEIIDKTHKYVDQFKVGKLNHHNLANQIDWQHFGERAVEKLRGLGKAFYIKYDLQKFLARANLTPEETKSDTLFLKTVQPPKKSELNIYKQLALF